MHKLVCMCLQNAVEATEKAKMFEEQVKKQMAEIKTLSENYNSERILRKKYYNLIEDMKGKIRVYCRVRPLSGSEKARVGWRWRLYHVLHFNFTKYAE